MSGLGGLCKLFRVGLTVKEMFEEKKAIDQHHMALLADDEYRHRYSHWWRIHMSVRERPHLVEGMTPEGRQAYDAFRRIHERVMPTTIAVSVEAAALARLQRYDELMQDQDGADPGTRIEAWNLSLDAIKDDGDA